MLPAELVFQDSPMLLIFPVVESGRCAGDRDGLLFDVIVKNMLPCVSHSCLATL